MFILGSSFTRVRVQISNVGNTCSDLERGHFPV
jgi:hypothetical protein